MNPSIDFVKGHCGFDIVTLVPGDQIPKGLEIETAKKIINPPMSGGIEVGYLYKEENTRHYYQGKPFEAQAFIGLKIIDSSHFDWLPMCGGMSQVIAKALVETEFQQYFGISADQDDLTIGLITDSGLVPLYLSCHNGQMTKVVTEMSGYVDFLYQTGVEPVVIDGLDAMKIDAMKVGYFLIFDINALTRAYPDTDFTRRNPSGDHADILKQLHESYMKTNGISDGLYSMLYDFNPEGSGHARLFSRFYDPSGITTAIPWEFQCGTGTIAAGVAMSEKGQLPFEGSKGSVICEWGSRRNTKDPYGIRTSELNIATSGSRVKSASFSHSVVEVLAEGRLTLPTY